MTLTKTSNMKALLLTIQKLWPMLKFFGDKKTERKTDWGKKERICSQSIDAGAYKLEKRREC